MLSTKSVYKSYIYLIYIYKLDLDLNNLQCLIYHKTQPNQMLLSNSMLHSEIFLIYIDSHLPLITEKWQEQWNSSTDNKLHSIKPTITEWQPGYRKIRQEEIVLAILCIGHIKITCNYFLKNDEPPMCRACEE